MSLETQIMNDLKQAMLAKDVKKMAAIRAVKAAILEEKTKGSAKDIDTATEIKMLQKLVKQRKESAAIYAQNNRPELAEEEEYQASIIEQYLPKQMSDDEIREMIRKIVSETGASSIKDMGKVMGLSVKQAGGRADNGVISQIVKEILGA